MTNDKEPGWISRATFMGLPDRFQKAARELAMMGEIEIESEETARSTSMTEGTHGSVV